MADAPQQTKGYQDFYSWARRRRFMYVMAGFCMIVIGYVLIANKDGAVADTAVTMSFLTLIGITGSYVFGAVWQDVSHMAAFSRNTSTNYSMSGQIQSPSVMPAGMVSPGE